MPISFTRYIDIISGVAAGASVGVRQLIPRLFTDNPLVPPGTDISFTDANDVGTYFGTSSAEYARAAFIFGWVSKNISVVPSIMFSRWVDTAVGSYIYGAVGTYAVITFTPITSGGFTLTLGGFTFTLSGINLSAAGSLTAVAAAIQTAVRAQTGGGAAWTGATVTYDATRGAFELFSGTTGADTIAIVAATTGTDLAAPLGWLTGAILGNGSAIETVTQTLTNGSQRSNNFGSFTFIPALSIAQHVQAATWNQTQNVMYMYSVPVLDANASTWSPQLINYGGTAMTLSPISTQFPELVPMMIMGATDYTQVNSVQNYMYQVFNLTPSVSTDANANTYDSLRINYYGVSQESGQLVQFYQRGILCGLQTNPVDMNTYANEAWLKSYIGAALINLQLDLAQIPANNTGTAQCLAIIKGGIKQALSNGTISAGKTLSDEQQAFITGATGDNTAWQQVATLGYWFNGVMASYVNTNTGLTEWKFVYTLIYSKDDVVRVIDGTHDLI